MSFKKVIALCLAATAVFGCAACADDGPSADVDGKYEWEFDKETVSETSDLPDWTQKEMQLTAWNANGTGGFITYRSDQDVVSKEIERVTGVSIDPKTSFDNKGSTVSAKLAQVVMSKNYPDIAYGTHETAEIIKANDNALVYDLTELVDKYCPTIKARMPKSVWSSPGVNGGKEGKVYGIPFNLGDVGLSTVDEDVDPTKTMPFEYQNDYYGCVYVREDILKDAYPEAKTYAEIQQIFAEKGKFTKDELYDVKITTADEFYAFLEKLYDTIHADEKYKLTSERWVTPILAADGMDRDNWSLMSGLWPKLMGASGYLNTMFSYWDAKDQKVKNMMLQPFFKEYLKKWNELIKEGKLTSNYGITTNYNTIQAELNQGYYAVAYPNAVPANYEATLADGSKVKYRKVYLQIEKGENFEFFAQAAPVPSSVVFFKNSVKESDLPQLLRWLDYQASRIADKLYAWGPRSAGLYTEENGVRQFKDAQLVEQMVYNTSSVGELVEKYNLSNGTVTSPQPTFPFFYAGGSREHPKCVYDLSKMSSMVDVFFSAAAVDPHPVVPIARRADIYTWSNSDLADVQTVWAKRASVEKAIAKVLTAGNFENAYNDMVTAARIAGWTDDYFGGTYTDVFLQLNRDYLDKFYRG